MRLMAIGIKCIEIRSGFIMYEVLIPQHTNSKGYDGFTYISALF